MSAQASKASGSSSQSVSVFFGLAERSRKPDGRLVMRFRWGRLAGLLAGLVVLGYVGASTLAWGMMRYAKKYETASYWDGYTIWWQMDEHRQEWGDQQVKMAKEELEEGDFRTALHLFRTGVTRSPGNLEGRTYLAALYGQALGDRNLAMDVIEGGLEYAESGEDAEFIKLYFQTLLNEQMDQRAIAYAEELLDSGVESEEIRELTALAAASAHRYRGNYDAAERLVREYDLDKTMEGVILSANISWDRGRTQMALRKLENALQTFPGNDLIYALLTRFNREAGNLSKAREYAVLRQINNPLAVSPRIDLLFIFEKTGEDERARHEIENIFRDFEKNPRGLLRLAEYATEVGNIELSRRVYETVLSRKHSLAPFALLLIEAHVTSGDYRGAIAFIEELREEKPAWLADNDGVFSSLSAVAYKGAGNQELCDLYLRQFLGKERLRVSTMLAVSKRFERIGALREARRILAHAYETDGSNQAALTGLISLDLQLGNSENLGDYLQQLLQMRRPSPELLAEAYRKLGSDRFIFIEDREELLLELDSMVSGATANGDAIMPETDPVAAAASST